MNLADGVFLSAMQPNTSAVSTYAVPAERLLPHGGTITDEATRTRRVQEQVAQRLAEKSNQPRRITTTPNYASSDYGGSSTMKYSTYTPNFSSKSYISNSRPVMAHRMPQQSSSGYSSRSAMDFVTRAQMSQGASTGIMYRQDNMGGFGGMSTMGGGYQSGQTYYHRTMPQMSRTISRGVPDADTISLHSQRMHPIQQQVWLTRNGSEGSLFSDYDNNLSSKEGAYVMNNGYTIDYPKQAMYSTTRNDFQSGASQMSMTLPAMRPSSGNFHNGSGMNMDEETFVRQSYKGPSQRTISKINQVRQNRSSVYGASMQGGAAGRSFGTIGAGSESNFNMYKGRMSRAPSMKSVVSVGHGVDLAEGTFSTERFQNMDIESAFDYLEDSDPSLQKIGVAFIQHACFENKTSREEVHKYLNGMKKLLGLLDSEDMELKAYATAAIRNVIYQHVENKKDFLQANGLPKLLKLLSDQRYYSAKFQDDDVIKNATGILWNLSARDELKPTIATQALEVLITEMLFPIFDEYDCREQDTPPDKETFVNTTGCLRNLSSLDTKTRGSMRATPRLVHSTVTFMNQCLEEKDHSTFNSKAVENLVCVLRNLSFQLYTEIPHKDKIRLSGDADKPDPYKQPIGCLSIHSKKDKVIQKHNIYKNVTQTPQEMEWLWHPQIVTLYHNILKSCTNSATREAAAGALQNITAGNERWATVLSDFAYKNQRIVPTIMDTLQTPSDAEKYTLVGLLRNLCRNEENKKEIGAEVVKTLVEMLPRDGFIKTPSPETNVNICSVLNHLVTNCEEVARNICEFDGVEKLINLKNDKSDLSKRTADQSSAAATLLFNMYQYTKLHKIYKRRGFTKQTIKELIK